MVNPLAVLGIALLLAVGETVLLWSWAVREIDSTEGSLVILTITILFWKYVIGLLLKSLRARVLLMEVDINYGIDFYYIVLVFLTFLSTVFLYLLILLFFSALLHLWSFFAEFFVFFILLSILHVLDAMLEGIIYRIEKQGI